MSFTAQMMLISTIQTCLSLLNVLRLVTLLYKLSDNMRHASQRMVTCYNDEDISWPSDQGI